MRNQRKSKQHMLAELELLRGAAVRTEASEANPMPLSAHLPDNESRSRLTRAYEELEKRVADLLETNERLKQEAAAKKKAEKALQESETLYRLLVETAKDVIWTVDLNLRYTYISPSIYQHLGYTQQECMSLNPLDTISPSSRERMLQTFQDEIIKEVPIPRREFISRNEEIEQYHKDGHIVWTEIAMTFLRDRHGHPVGILGVSRDITDRKRTEDQLRASLQEKEVLLREVHHRVKNNLQVVASLLRLESRNSQDHALRDLLRSTEGRIESMALVHDKLCKSRDLNHIDVGSYLKTLLSALWQSHDGATDHTRPIVEVKSGPLALDTAVSCGLIAHELVANSLKHAFPNRRQGEIVVSLNELEGDEFVLAVRDNGIGIPEELDCKTQARGLALVKTLAKQLRAEIQVNRQGGTEVSIRFKRPESGKVR